MCQENVGHPCMGQYIKKKKILSIIEALKDFFVIISVILISAMDQEEKL